MSENCSFNMKIKIKDDSNSVPDAPLGFKVGVLQADNPRDVDWTMLAVGDIGLSGKIGRTAQRSGSASSLFGQVPKFFADADIVFGNLETPLIDDWTPECMFAGSSKWAPDIKELGIDVANFASNHMYDYGAKGFQDTISAVENSGITILGAGKSQDQARKLTVKEVKGTRVGFLAAGHTNIKQSKNGPFLWELEIDELVDAVSKYRSQVDCLVVSIHWGPMLIDYPYMEQYKGAHRLVDAGASAVLMHHAHILQGVEVYKMLRSVITWGILFLIQQKASIRQKHRILSASNTKINSPAEFSVLNGRKTDF